MQFHCRVVEISIAQTVKKRQESFHPSSRILFKVSTCNVGVETVSCFKSILNGNHVHSFDGLQNATVAKHRPHTMQNPPCTPERVPSEVRLESIRRPRQQPHSKYGKGHWQCPKQGQKSSAIARGYFKEMQLQRRTDVEKRPSQNQLFPKTSALQAATRNQDLQYPNTDGYGSGCHIHSSAELILHGGVGRGAKVNASPTLKTSGTKI